jgi:serine/arginine repetitive matrix protein 2
MAVSSQPLTRETANPNAATAAASAFLRREGTPSLSSAAAAAALKARPTTPTNVSQVQSKRVSRRSASVSSTGSRDRRSRDLHRSPSANSMTERTFRSPSPSPARNPAPQSHDVPPVPKIPQNEQVRTDVKNPTRKRATSLQTQSFQTASQKMKNGQGTWFGAAAAGDMSNMRRANVVDKRASVDLRPSSPSSINFSYPRSMTDSPSQSNNAMVYDPNSRRMVPQAQLLMQEQEVRDASEKPVRKHKHESSRAGSHLSKGTLGRLKGTAVEPVSPPPKTAKQAQSPPVVHAAVIQPEQTKQVSQAKSEPEPAPEPDLEPESDVEREVQPGLRPNVLEEQTMHESDLESDDEASRQTDGVVASPPRTAKSETSIRKRPSIVHEDREQEEEYEPVTTTVSQERPVDGVDAIPVKSTTPPQTQTSVPVDHQNESVRRTRVHSESPARSPARTTHFAPKTDQLLVRHEPPPRSLSPRKSALKYSSPRDASPSEDGSDASAAWSGMAREDSDISRKKSARVSFDDGNTAIMGEAAPASDTDSPRLASPQSKKSWHSIIGRKKRDSITLDEDETMTPRPALPSFGSVREKKVREPEERPLVRPTDRSASPPIAATSHPTEADEQSTTQDLAQSSDYAIGSVLTQEQASRNEANTSRYREPLPPVVTSVDGQGYISNSDMESDIESDVGNLETQTSTGHGVETQTTVSDTAGGVESDSAKSSPSDNIPTISIIHPSPRIPDENQSDSPSDFFDVPGDFPAETDAGTNKKGISDESKEPVQIATRRSFDSNSAVSSNSQMHDIQEESEESEESDGSSIYSDAYEDLSDMEGDGFLSLDAVVDSPVEPTVPQRVLEKAMAKSQEADKSQQSTPIKSTPQVPLQTPSDWQTAKAYWRSLSPEGRRQLEKEAMEDSDEEPIPEQTVRRPKHKAKTHAKAKDAKELVQEPSEEPEVSEKLRSTKRVYQIQPGTSWPRDDVEKPRAQASTSNNTTRNGGGKLRKSMRGSTAPAVDSSKPAQSGSMRKSMRSGAAPSSPQNTNDGHLRKSLRQEPEASVTPNTGMRKSLRANGSTANGHTMSPTPKNGARPTSYQPATASETVKTQRRTHSEDRGPSMRGATKPALSRRGSDSSESSFRRAKVGGGEGLGFRRTMRGSVREPAPATAPAQETPRGSSRFSLRSLSPTGFRRNSNTSSPPPVVMGGRMRQSLRSESSEAEPSRKRLSGFGRPAKAKKSNGGSRFEDSSDEDESRPSFRSRFVDSSDEDILSPIPKQKRVPKTMRGSSSNGAAAAAAKTPASRAGMQDSPDLPDSDDDEEQPQQGITSNGAASRSTPVLNRNGSGRGNFGVQNDNVEKMGARPGHKRRGSFMSSILRRKKDPSDKISRNTSESASRRDTHLERAPERLAVIRSNSEGAAHNSRLQKRGANWPLKDHEHTHEEEDRFDEGSQNTYVVDEEKRPSTAGGLGSSPSSPTNKTGFLKRRSTSHSQMRSRAMSTDGSEVGTPKKKKFGALRRMFKLDE